MRGDVSGNAFAGQLDHRGQNHRQSARLPVVALAGVLPDLDGLGIVADVFNHLVRHKETACYQDFHHFLMHGALGAAVVSAALACFARRRGRVAILALLVYHLHLLCDLVGSRGPDPGDKWPIWYLAPLSRASDVDLPLAVAAGRLAERRHLHRAFCLGHGHDAAARGFHHRRFQPEGRRGVCPDTPGMAPIIPPPV